MVERESKRCNENPYSMSKGFLLFRKHFNIPFRLIVCENRVCVYVVLNRTTAQGKTIARDHTPALLSSLPSLPPLLVTPPSPEPSTLPSYPWPAIHVALSLFILSFLLPPHIKLSVPPPTPLPLLFSPPPPPLSNLSQNFHPTCSPSSYSLHASHSILRTLSKSVARHPFLCDFGCRFFLICSFWQLQQSYGWWFTS